MRTASFARRSLLALTAALALPLAACAGSTTSDAPTSGGTAAPAADGEQVTIEMWDYLGQGVSNTAMTEAIAKFEELNPGIKVNRTSFAYPDLSPTIVKGGVGGDVPDLAVVDVVDNQNFASLGLLADLTESVGGRSNEFYPGPWSSTQMDGKTYGLPLNSNNLALYYNKTLLDQAGLSVPTTWEELASTGKALSKDGVSGLAISAIKNEQGTFQVLPFVWQTGGDLDNYGTSGGEALTFLKGLVDDGVVSAAVTNYSQEDARTQFTAGKAAMMINGPWELQNLADVPFEWAVAPLPAGKAKATGLGGENVVVMQEAKQPEAARLLAEFLTGSEGAKIYCDASGQLSARPDLKGKLKLSADPNLQVYEAQMEHAKARAYGKDYAKVSEAVQLSIQEALTGAVDPKEAAKKAEQTLSGLLTAEK
ncbi:ABC transporter substrate-binding protein [Buchananella hordeovulneris]|uniref:ABC transporter substrate-binding protein n=1 Tax=Buchananella hordeovulneris TaxID=52770 RepID=UPI000F5EFC2D|nr:sugar ABC transporter substrate-binding protein [Buchananella hordeovulneris]RRD42996.1 sugar ABC transporter substrate-binding protein [Buchananella hordeovulneris]